MEPKIQIGYCGNVHPGRTIAEVKQNLTTYSLDVKSQVCPNQPMGIGLWLSATAARELDDRDSLFQFRDWLAEAGFVPFTLNGFPYGDFHQEVVKHDVYLPTWAQPERLEYTLRMAEIQNVLLPPQIDGSISTLPLGWPVVGGKSNLDDQSFWNSCARNLKSCAERLDNLAQTSGRNICVCLEPEPGCVLDTCEDVVGFFDQNLLTGDTQSNQRIKKHIGVCHDICHSAVMFEEQSKAVDAFRLAGIRIGKVQVSSAVAVDFDAGDVNDRTAKLIQLRSFAEPKYLHQTSVLRNGQQTFFEDLHLALAAFGEHLEGQWRVHFHVPIFSSTLDAIGTTQSDIQKCIESIRKSGEPMPHLEIETYAWNVLPKSLRQESLADGIAKELKWFEQLMDSDASLAS